jgi:hypothetical protein
MPEAERDAEAIASWKIRACLLPERGILGAL